MNRGSELVLNDLRKVQWVGTREQVHSQHGLITLFWARGSVEQSSNALLSVICCWFGEGWLGSAGLDLGYNKFGDYATAILQIWLLD